MATSVPTVSVLVPTLNRPQFVGAALASIRAQTFTDFEVIVQDAGSTEPVPAYAAAVTAADPRFHVHRSTRQLTAPEARNAALAHARGRFIALLDSDDLMAPGRLEQQVSALTADERVVLVGGGLNRIDANGLDQVRKRDTDRMAPERRPATPSAIRWLMPFVAPSLSSALTMRADALLRVGGFDEELTTCDDYSLMWFLSEIGDVRILPGTAAHYRVHGNQISLDSRGPQHKEYIGLRRRILSARLGHPVPLAQVMTATSKFAASESVKFDTIVMVNELLERFLESEVMGDVDRSWVVANHALRVADIRELPIGVPARRANDYDETDD